MALIQSYSESNVDFDGVPETIDPTTGVQSSRMGLAFLLPASPTYSLTSIKFWMKKTGTITGTARMRLFAATGTIESATPTGAELAGVDFDISTLTTSYALYEFTFTTPYVATVNTTYCAYFRNPTSGSGFDASNFPSIGMKNLGGNGINQVRNDTSADNWIANSRSPAYYLYGNNLGSPSLSPSASQSPSASLSPSASSSHSSSSSASSSASKSLSPSASSSASMSASQSPSSSASKSLSPSFSASASASASGSASLSESSSASSSASASPSPAEYDNKYASLGNTYIDKYTSTL